jgi:hypothetical protein
MEPEYDGNQSGAETFCSPKDPNFKYLYLNENFLEWK